jgi:hypothetical protein
LLGFQLLSVLWVGGFGYFSYKRADRIAEKWGNKPGRPDFIRNFGYLLMTLAAVSSLALLFEVVLFAVKGFKD